MNEAELRDRHLELWLEERLGGQEAPDLAERVLQADAATVARVMHELQPGRGPKLRPLWIAALLTLAVSLVWGLRMLLDEGGAEQAREPEPAPVDDPVQDPEILRPKTQAELARLLERVQHLEVRVLVTERHSHRFAAAPAPLRIGREQFETVIAAMGRRSTRHPAAGWKWPNTLRFVLDDGRCLEGAMYMLGRPRVLHIRGMGDREYPAPVHAFLLEKIRAAEHRARMAQGVAFAAADLAVGGIDAGVEGLACYGLGDEDLEGISRLHKIRLLDLRGCRKTLVGPGLRHLAPCRKLRHVLLNWTAIEDPHLGLLASLPELNQLNLDYAQNLSGAGFAAFAKHPNLSRLNLRYLPQLDDAGLIALARLPALRHLDLSGRRLGKASAAGLRALAELSTLESLDLADCPLSLGPALAALGQLKNLSFLDLSDTRVTREDLEAYAKGAGAAGLRSLWLTRCRSLDAADLQALRALLPAAELKR